MNRGWVAGAGMLLISLGSAEVIYNLHGNEVAVQAAAVCTLLVAGFACFRIAKWADKSPNADSAVKLESAPLAASSTTHDPEPQELLAELRSLGYAVRREGARWRVTEPNSRISLYFSSNEALRDEASSLRGRAKLNRGNDA